MTLQENHSGEDLLTALQARAAQFCSDSAAADRLVLRTLENAIALGKADRKVYCALPALVNLLESLARAS